jgi:hypothetical protein
MFTFKSCTKANSIIIVNIWWMRKFWKGVFGISILRAQELYIRWLKNIGDLWDQKRVELISWKIIWKKCQFEKGERVLGECIVDNLPQCWADKMMNMRMPTLNEERLLKISKMMDPHILVQYFVQWNHFRPD